jgi:methionine synthase I (cobalamin-dependent)/5,10-methylenetetrahydrofolate reductase
MKRNILEFVQDHILIGDGAMGTLLHHYGIPVGSCGEELNLTQPNLIRDIHLTYVRAGANLIETNTYGANTEKLAKFGLEEQVEEINRAAVRMAREAAGQDAFVMGSVGSILGARKRHIALPDLKRAYEEQIVSLMEEGVDGIVLETFCYIDELLLALSVVRQHSIDLPVLSQLSIQESRRTQEGVPLEQAFGRLLDEGSNMVGLNCYNGPSNIIRSLESIPLTEGLILSAFPNAGLPDYVDGEFVYGSSPEYFGRSAEELHQLGVRIIGGCCGTTPEHIAAASSRLLGKKPVLHREISIPEKGQEKRVVQLSINEREKTLPQMVKEQSTVIVELDPPRDLDYLPFLEGAAELQRAGVDAITLADNSLAMTRMSNMALGSMIKERLGIRPLVHMTCRDRNLIGQQSHLMGLYALGIDHVLVVTGDPTRFGDLPGSSSVYDMTSFDLIRMVKQLNGGTSFSGRPLKHQAGFTVAAAFNPNTRHLGKAVERLEKKVEAGADYVLSQPIFSHEQIAQMAEATQHLSIPIFVGIMPLTSHRNAEFLHNEVPGIRLSEEVRQRMSRFEGEDARKQGVEIAMELLQTAQRHFKGIYLITPFMRYEMTAELTRFAKANASAVESNVL